MTIQLVLAALAGYLLGNLQTAVIFSKWKYHDDIRNHGSGNAGSTNMLRVFGVKSGLVTFTGDFCKGILAVLLGRLIAGEHGAYIAALFAVIGHDFPLFLQFKGGKGVASTFAIIWMIQPLYAAIITAAAVILLLITRTISPVSIGCATLYMVLVVVFQWSDTPLIVLSAALWALIIIRHTDNIKRLLHGEESKLFEKKKKKNSDCGG